MEVPFNELPPNSKVWIYQSNKELEEHEIEYIKQKTKEFVQTWQSHGRDISAGFSILYNRFLVISASPHSEASGCSIDKIVHFIQKTESDLQIKLLDRSFVIYKTETGFHTISLPKAKEMVASGEIPKSAAVFNNSITLLEEMENKWEVEIENSWLSKYIPI
ncbi:MAG: hypothetical protein ACK4ND_03165 [Cytophagaceae bacterium]